MATQSVDRAIRLLFLVAERGRVRVGQAAQELGVNKATASRLASTLAEWGLLVKDGLNGQYALGPANAHLGTLFLERLDIRNVARPYLERLSEETGETVTLSHLIEDEVLYVDIVESSHPVRIHAQIGKRYPLHCGGSSKAILAFMPVSHREKILGQSLKAYTSKTIVNPVQLRQHLQRIRVKGYSVSEGELTPGATAIGVPVFDHQANVIGGVGMVGPSSRLTPNKIPALAHATQEAAAGVSRAAGYRGGPLLNELKLEKG